MLKITKTPLDGVILIEPDVHGDNRGFFKESFQEKRYKDIGIDYSFVQDNISRSKNSPFAYKISLLKIMPSISTIHIGSEKCCT